MPMTAPQIPIFGPSETRGCRASFDSRLESTDTLTGTPTVLEVTSTDLTLSNPAVSVAALEVLGETHAIGRVVTFDVSGQVANTRYTVHVRCNTTSGETLAGQVRFDCRADGS